MFLKRRGCVRVSVDQTMWLRIGCADERADMDQLDPVKEIWRELGLKGRAPLRIEIAEEFLPTDGGGYGRAEITESPWR